MKSQGIFAFSLARIDSSFSSLVREMVKHQVPPGRFTNLGHLLAAEEVLDLLAAHGIKDSEYLDIEGYAKAYLAQHPELLDSPWLRNGGAVYDLITSAREARLIQQESVAMLEKRTA